MGGFHGVGGIPPNCGGMQEERFVAPATLSGLP